MRRVLVSLQLQPNEPLEPRFRCSTCGIEQSKSDFKEITFTSTMTSNGVLLASERHNGVEAECNTCRFTREMREYPEGLEPADGSRMISRRFRL